MADFSTLTELAAAPATGDLLLIRDISAGSNQDKKITVSNLLSGVAFAGGNHNFGNSTITNLTIGTSLTFSSGVAVTNIRRASASVTFTNILTLEGQTQTMAVTGVQTTDHISWSSPDVIPDGVIVQAWVSATGTVSIRFFNTTGGTITGASYTIRILAIVAS